MVDSYAVEFLKQVDDVVRRKTRHQRRHLGLILFLQQFDLSIVIEVLKNFGLQRWYRVLQDRPGLVASSPSMNSAVRAGGGPYRIREAPARHPPLAFRAVRARIAC